MTSAPVHSFGEGFTLISFAQRTEIARNGVCAQFPDCGILKTDLGTSLKAAMNVLLELPKETADKVARAAADAGKDMPAFLQDFVKQSFTDDATPRRSVAEILAPFRAQVEQSGMNDEQLDSLFTSARQNAFTTRHRNGG
jgi:hypothetical protein